VFYLANGFCLWADSHAKPSLRRTLLTATMTNSWFINSGNGGAWGPYDFTGWTVTTLTFFYLVFPLVLPGLQTLTSSQLVTLSVWLYHLQLWPVWLFLSFSREYSTSGLHPVTWLVTAHPLTRLPVFLMGACLGLVRVRGEDDCNLGRGVLHSLLPWGLTGAVPTEGGQEAREKAWGRRVDLGVLCLALLVAGCRTLMRLEMAHKMAILVPVERLVLVHTQLMVIVGLTADGGTSWFGKICRCRPVMLLGRVSMALYMFHVPILRFITAWRLGWPIHSYSTLAVAAATSLTTAAVSTFLFEEPLRRLLQAKSARAQPKPEKPSA